MTAAETARRLPEIRERAEKARASHARFGLTASDPPCCASAADVPALLDLVYVLRSALVKVVSELHCDDPSCSCWADFRDEAAVQHWALGES